MFLGGCDMRCPFCHNAELVDGTAEAVMDEQGLKKFLSTRSGLLDGVAFTGGEPLLRADLAPLFRSIREMGFAVKLDTNGTHPDRLRALLEEGLVDYVAMDIKNSPERYGETAGVPEMDLGPVKESVELLKEGRTDYEFRTTVVAELHDDDSFREIGPWIRGARRYFLQKFTDRETVPFGGFHAPAEEDLRRWAEMMRAFVQEVSLRGVD